MPITNGYATLAEVKAYLKYSDTADDTLIEAAVNAASRLIDTHCGRRFYRTSETRAYTARDADLLLTDDYGAVTTVTTDEDGDGTYENTLSASSYIVWPANAALEDDLPSPYCGLRITQSSAYRWPVGVTDGVRITATFGFAATAPDAVKQACIIQAARLHMRKGAVFGTQFSQEFGAVSVVRKGIDPDAELLLMPFTRLVA